MFIFIPATAQYLLYHIFNHRGTETLSFLFLLALLSYAHRAKCQSAF